MKVSVESCGLKITIEDLKSTTDISDWPGPPQWDNERIRAVVRHALLGFGYSESIVRNILEDKVKKK